MYITDYYTDLSKWELLFFAKKKVDRTEGYHSKYKSGEERFILDQSHLYVVYKTMNQGIRSEVSKLSWPAIPFPEKLLLTFALEICLA